MAGMPVGSVVEELAATELPILTNPPTRRAVRARDRPLNRLRGLPRDPYMASVVVQLLFGFSRAHSIWIVRA